MLKDENHILLRDIFVAHNVVTSSVGIILLIQLTLNFTLTPLYVVVTGEFPSAIYLWYLLVLSILSTVFISYYHLWCIKRRKKLKEEK